MTPIGFTPHQIRYIAECGSCHEKKDVVGMLWGYEICGRCLLKTENDEYDGAENE